MKWRALVLDREALAVEIASLSKLDIDELRERWKAMYGKAPSQEIGRSFLTRAIAYRLQEQAYGGLKPSTRRLLARVAEQSVTGSSPKPQLCKAQSGTILIREWQGNPSPGDDARRRSLIQREALPFAFGGSTRDHRQSVVGAAVFRTAIACEENNHGTP